MDIRLIRNKIENREYRFTFHGFERCAEKRISPEEVKSVIIVGRIIEEYPADKYGPSCLICGIIEEGKILHVQCSIDPVWVITAYDPTLSPDEWDETFTRRRMKQ